MEFIHHPGESDRLGDWLKHNLEKEWSSFRAAIAFVKRSGTRHIKNPLSKFAEAREVEIVTGIDHQGSSYEGLQDLLDAVSPNGQIVVFHNRLALTFHPKVYVFRSETAADLVIGSGNLTEGGLFSNYEASLRLQLNLAESGQAELLRSIENAIDLWANAHGTSRHLDADFLETLKDLRLVATERSSVPTTGGAASRETGKDEDDVIDEIPFTARPERRAPPIGRSVPATGIVPHGTAGKPGSKDLRFVMTLQKTDVGIGQTTAGTSRRSPEIFVPLAARDANPEFWDWPGSFAPDPSRPNKHDRRGVLVRMGSNAVSVNMMTWPDRHDFRLRSEALRSAGNIGDILRVEKVNPQSGFHYLAEVIPQKSARYAFCFSKCDQIVRNSRKRFGYY